MGWTEISADGFGQRFGYSNREYRRREERLMEDVPAYSTTWECMGLVVEAMREKGWWCRIQSPFVGGEPWHVGFTPAGTTGWNGRPDHQGSADTAPRAACIAALRAVGVRPCDA